MLSCAQFTLPFWHRALTAQRTTPVANSPFGARRYHAFSNTYGEFERLRACYAEALAHPQISGLAIGIGSEVPPSLKLAPEWKLRLSELAPRLSVELARRSSWQGCR